MQTHCKRNAVDRPDTSSTLKSQTTLLGEMWLNDTSTPTNLRLLLFAAFCLSSESIAKPSVGRAWAPKASIRRKRLARKQRRPRTNCWLRLSSSSSPVASATVVEEEYELITRKPRLWGTHGSKSPTRQGPYPARHPEPSPGPGHPTPEDAHVN